MGKEYKWNEVDEFLDRCFWDPTTDTLREQILNGTSLKGRLANPMSGSKAEDVIGDIAEGLALIMDEIEEMRNESNKGSRTRRF